MAKKKGLYGVVVEYEKTTKGTSIASMNKHKRKGRTKKQLRYRGQGK